MLWRDMQESVPGWWELNIAIQSAISKGTIPPRECIRDIVLGSNLNAAHLDLRSGQEALQSFHRLVNLFHTVFSAAERLQSARAIRPDAYLDFLMPESYHHPYCQLECNCFCPVIVPPLLRFPALS
jgi:hypothetical protein